MENYIKSWDDLEHSLQTYVSKHADVKHQLLNAASLQEYFEIYLNHAEIGGRINRWLNTVMPEMRDLSYKSCAKMKSAYALGKKTNKTYEDRLAHFNTAICHSMKTSDIWVDIIQRRKDLHYNNEDYESCLADIETLLEYTDNNTLNMMDLWKQKYDVLMKLYEINMLTDALVAEDFLTEQLKNNRDVLEKTVKRLSDNYKARAEPMNFGDENKRLPGASSKLEPMNFGQGKLGVKSNAPISELEPILTETAVASILVPSYLKKACQNCLKETRSPLSCECCCEIIFCSEKCMRDGARFHTYEAGCVNFLGSNFIAHLALRTFLVSRWNLCSSNILKLQRLINHEKDIDDDEMLSYHMVATFLVLYLKTNTPFFLGIQCVDLPHTCTIVLRLLLQVVCNTTTLPVLERVNSPSNTFMAVCQKNKGAAIFSTLSTLNHACVSNIIKSYTGNKVVVHAMYDIGIGQELFNCYVDARECGYAERRQKLRNTLNYDCECEVCNHPGHPLHNIDDRAFHFRCLYCKSFIQYYDAASRDTVCGACAKRVVRSAYANHAAIVDGLYERGLNSEKEGKLPEAQVFFAKALSQCEKIMPITNPVYAKLFMDTMRFYCTKHGPLKKTWEIISQGRLVMLEHYGIYSYQYLRYLEYVFSLYLEVAERSEYARELMRGSFGKDLIIDGFNHLQVSKGCEILNQFERTLMKTVEATGFHDLEELESGITNLEVK